MTPFKWKKKGLLIAPGAGRDGFTHASHACALHITEDEFLLIYSVRNSNSRAHIFSQKATVTDGSITPQGEPTMSLGLGMLGTFDSDGLLVCAPVKISEDKSYLYYSGWNNLRSDYGDLWLCDTGLATINHKTLEFARAFEGPVMSRNRHNPLFAAATSVLLEEGIFKSWYNSGLNWEAGTDQSKKMRYGIHYAESNDGLDWQYFPGLVIPLKDEFEHSFGRPCVAAWNNKYHMLFSCRGGQNDPRYRLGYACSEDGRSWLRDDSVVGLDPSQDLNDFDSDAVAYPFFFEHDGWRYLLYSGNDYGRTGTGYAVEKL